MRICSGIFNNGIIIVIQVLILKGILQLIWQMEKEDQQRQKEVNMIEIDQKTKKVVLGNIVVAMDYTIKENGWKTKSMVQEKKSVQKAFLTDQIYLDECYEGEILRGVKYVQEN